MTAPHGSPASHGLPDQREHDQLPAAAVDVLLPTADRPSALAATLAGLLGQQRVGFRLVIADQSAPGPATAHPEVATAVAALRRAGVTIELTVRPERRGIAEQRQWLLDQATAPRVLCLDDDVLLAPAALVTMVEALDTLGCGMVGMPAVGLSHLEDERPGELTSFEVWDGPVHPERIRKGDAAWERWRLHNAANPVHLERAVQARVSGWVPYKVAWINGCVLFDTEVLRRTGGYAFWSDLPANLRGEDVVAQLRVIEAAGGAGLIPTLAHHLELPTSLTDRRVDAYAAVLEAGTADGGTAA